MSADLTAVPDAELLAWLRAAMRQRRAHRLRAATRIAQYEALWAQATLHPPRTADNVALLLLYRAQEASRGSRIRARRLHEEWERRCLLRVVRESLIERERETIRYAWPLRRGRMMRQVIRRHVREIRGIQRLMREAP